jgi:pyruvate/2-oxoglutarate dehydrogenase complex dihydrolipoamide acyltransferase (E2) component
MAIEITAPKLGLTMEEAVLVKWCFEPGDRVAKDDTVLILETDKITYEMPSPGGGLLHPVVAPGETIKVSQIVGYLAVDAAELEALAAQHPAAEVPEIKPVEVEPAVANLKVGAAAPASGARIKASPLARAMAKEHGLELPLIPGSGPGGRIIRVDVLKALEEGPPPAVAGTPEEELILTASQEIPITGVRKIIFQNMHASLQNQAQFTLQTEVSAEGLIELRNQLNRRYAKEGIIVSYNAIIVKAVAQALRLHPTVNVSTDGERIKVWRQIHIGVAMDLGGGLIVPKVRRPDLKGIRDISLALDDLVAKAKGKKLLPDDLAAGTFTITNLGAWDVDHFTPIVNPPESAILGVGRLVEKPVVSNGEVKAEPRLALSLTIDHRVIDGTPGAAFLKTIKDYLENPMLMLE